MASPTRTETTPFNSTMFSVEKIKTNAEADSVGLGRFTEVMRAKLTKKREQGRGGWHRPDECTVEELRHLMREHVDKGDPTDIANFAMMIWNREHPNG